MSTQIATDKLEWRKQSSKTKSRINPFRKTTPPVTAVERTTVLATDDSRYLVAQLIVDVVAKVDYRETMQHAMFNALMADLLQRLGFLLGEFLFKCGFRNDPGKIGITPPTRSLQRLSYRLQAPFLIWLLERLLALLSRYADDYPTRTFSARIALERVDLLAKQDSRPPGLQEKLRHRLQNTMLEGVFPHRAGQFGNRLDDLSLTPLTVEADPPAPPLIIPEQDVEQWFVLEIWRLLGWDVLQKLM